MKEYHNDALGAQAARLQDCFWQSKYLFALAALNAGELPALPATALRFALTLPLFCRYNPRGDWF